MTEEIFNKAAELNAKIKSSKELLIKIKAFKNNGVKEVGMVEMLGETQQRSASFYLRDKELISKMASFLLSSENEKLAKLQAEFDNLK